VSSRSSSTGEVLAPLPRIDLHAHTTASDGSLTPEELVRLAKSQGVSTLAVTDHDTIAGLSRAIAEGERVGVEIIPGIEISCLYKQTELHILGYFINPGDPHLKPALARYSCQHRPPPTRQEVDTCRGRRDAPTPPMVRRLKARCCHTAAGEVNPLAGPATAGPPHTPQWPRGKGDAGRSEAHTHTPSQGW